jgi:hypothetical protein
MYDEQRYPNRDELPAPVVGTGGLHRVKKDGITSKRSLKLIGPGGHFWRMKHWLNERLSKKQVIFGGLVFVLLLGGLVAFGLANRAAAPEHPPVVAKKSPAPAPAVITSPLTGLPVTAEQAARPVTGVMIENSDFARPQSGLSQAGVVFEAIAEAGITRFLTLFQDNKPNNIGPIRSVRPYFLQWDLGFDASIAHVGGSPEALNDIKAWHAKNIGEFAYGSYYHRISSREAPHNMYTSVANLNAIEKKNGWTSSNFTGFPRKKDSPSKSPNAIVINLNPSSSDFAVRYTYDGSDDSYYRWLAGAKHVDANTGKQLKPKVVIAIVVPYNIESDGYHSHYATIGSGKAYVFQDGTVTVGTWKKASNTSQIQFLDASGNPIDLNAGQTWITALGSAGDVSYKP